MIKGRSAALAGGRAEQRLHIPLDQSVAGSSRIHSPVASSARISSLPAGHSDAFMAFHPQRQCRRDAAPLPAAASPEPRPWGRTAWSHAPGKALLPLLLLLPFQTHGFQGNSWEPPCPKTSQWAEIGQKGPGQAPLGGQMLPLRAHLAFLGNRAKNTVPGLCGKRHGGSSATGSPSDLQPIAHV